MTLEMVVGSRDDHGEEDVGYIHDSIKGPRFEPEGESQG